MVKYAPRCGWAQRSRRTSCGASPGTTSNTPPIKRWPNLVRRTKRRLNVVETWNSANSFILYGRGGEIATDRTEDQEITMLSLYLLQVSLVYINTLMIQRVLQETAWTDRLTAEDRRALTPLLWGHVNPYGLFRLDMSARLAIDKRNAAAQ